METTLSNNEFRKLLMNFMQTAPGSTEYGTLSRRLECLIADPPALDKSGMIPETHPFKFEVQAAADAFESVTNGMHDPDAMSRLSRLPVSSPLNSWREITYAIEAFYRQDTASMNRHLAKIPGNTPPASLKPVLLHLTGAVPIHVPSSKQNRIINEITEDLSFVTSSKNQLIDLLEHDMEEMFIETAILLVKELLPAHTEAAVKIAQWSLSEASSRRYSLEEFFARFKTLFGNTESIRLSAAALGKTEPDISLLLWLKSLSGRLKQNDISPSEVQAYLLIAAETAEEALNSRESIQSMGEPDYQKGLAGVLSNLEKELKIHFPDLFRNLSGDTDKGIPFIFELSNKTLPGSLELSKESTAIIKKGKPVQLELF